MKLLNQILKAFFLIAIITSCSDDDEIIREVEVEVEVERETEYRPGAIISAEGAFGSKNGSLSFLNDDLSSVSNFIYDKKNSAPVGGLIQSVTFGEEYAYIVLNDANQIVIANKVTLERIGVIETGLDNPRYMAIADGKGYVTNWGNTGDENDDFVAVYNLTDNTFLTSIAVELGPERIINVNNNLYVTHKGAFTTNNKVSVIANDAVSTVIDVFGNPDEIEVNSQGNLTVLCEGGGFWQQNDAGDFEFVNATPAAIQTINPNTNTIINTIEFTDGIKPSLLALDNGNIYYYVSGTGINTVSETASAPASTDVIFNDNLYGMNANDGKIYTTKFAFSTLSQLSVIDITTKDILFQTAVGLGASKIYFVE